MLQQDPAIASMSAALTKRVLDLLSRLAENEADTRVLLMVTSPWLPKSPRGHDVGYRSRSRLRLRWLNLNALRYARMFNI
jgi:hypothetical protein